MYEYPKPPAFFSCIWCKHSHEQVIYGLNHKGPEVPIHINYVCRRNMTHQKEKTFGNQHCSLYEGYGRQVRLDKLI